MAGMRELAVLGQSVWLDYIRRRMVRSGELQTLIDRGLRGLTSNPSIFEQAITAGTEYDEDLRRLIQSDPEATPARLFEHLAISDIGEAADALRPVYDEFDGMDGFVSLEVSPHLADDAAGTVADARRLWQDVDRPNLMIKVPATVAGIEAIHQLTAAGVNVNATLLFSVAQYEGVAQAYITGLGRASEVTRIASVASFFVSRVDTLVDSKLDALGSAEAKALRGTAAVANAKLAYQRFLEIFHGPAFEALRARGARAQRVLFGSTSTKDPTYPDVKYVEELIGAETVNTLPPATIEAFLDHGRAELTLTRDIDRTRRVMSALSGIGIDMAEVTEELQRDGVKKFAASYDSLMSALEAKRDQILQLTP